VNELERRVAAEIRRRGPVPLTEVVDAALYDPELGFYSTTGSPGRRGDFLTSPEVGPLFGAVLARALDGWWDEMGRPDPFLVVDAGAGPGTLARAVLAAGPHCACVLRYVLVERSAALRARQLEGLPHVEPHLAFAVGSADPDSDTGPAAPLPRGPMAISLAELPRGGATPAVVVANELLDNLPFALAERRGDQWLDVRVDLDDDRDALVERLVPLDDSAAGRLARWVGDVADGARVPVQPAASEWLRDALEVAGGGGRVVVFDYADTLAGLAARPWEEWVRTYRSHQRGDHPLRALGTQDITCVVAIQPLAAVRHPAMDRVQSEFLAAHGLGELVADGRRAWAAGAAAGDLAALRARSRVSEAEALVDPTGLGSFRVLEWEG
jgi:SAM-dependent MidA family methyltransferase